jgi:hypothetical protein
VGMGLTHDAAAEREGKEDAGNVVVKKATPGGQGNTGEAVEQTEGVRVEGKRGRKKRRTSLGKGGNDFLESGIRELAGEDHRGIKGECLRERGRSPSSEGGEGGGGEDELGGEGGEEEDGGGGGEGGGREGGGGEGGLAGEDGGGTAWRGWAGLRTSTGRAEASEEETRAAVGGGGAEGGAEPGGAQRLRKSATEFWEPST